MAQTTINPTRMELMRLNNNKIKSFFSLYSRFDTEEMRGSGEGEGEGDLPGVKKGVNS